MILTFIILFWICVYCVLHSYIVFPILLTFIGRRRKANQAFYKMNEIPEVTIIIAAHNEEKVIRKKIESTFISNYPLDKINVFVGSDCSNDSTNQIIKEFQKKYNRLTLFEFNKRKGKANILNDLVKKSTSDVLIFTDANVFFKENTIYELVKHYKNKEIGQVGGNIMNTNVKETGISYQEKNYLDWEKQIKNNEGIIWGTMIGAFGGCYSMRKELYKDIPQGYLMDDFYVSMNVFEKDQKSIFEPNAICFEDVSDKISEEFRRKIRISAGNFQNLFSYKHLLIKPNFGLVFSFLSHKVFRWKTPFFILTTLVTSFIIGRSIELYAYLCFIQAAVFVILPLDFLLKKMGTNVKLFRFITHFISMNLALLIGFFKFLFGVKTSAWKPTERNQ